MAKSGYKGVSRIDLPYKKTHGWQVRVWFKGKRYTKFFNDKWYATQEESLQAAVEYRDQVEKDLGKPRTPVRVVTQSGRSKTGVVGVSRVKRRVVRPSGEPKYVEIYEATWHSKDKKVQRRRFAISKYGEEEAFRLASAWRREQELLHGRALEAPSLPSSEDVPPVVIKYVKADDVENTGPFYEISMLSKSGVLWRRTVSIDRYGEEQAYSRACSIKKRKESESLPVSMPEDSPTGSP